MKFSFAFELFFVLIYTVCTAILKQIYMLGKISSLPPLVIQSDSLKSLNKPQLVLEKVKFIDMI